MRDAKTESKKEVGTNVANAKIFYPKKKISTKTDTYCKTPTKVFHSPVFSLISFLFEISKTRRKKKSRTNFWFFQRKKHKHKNTHKRVCKMPWDKTLTLKSFSLEVLCEVGKQFKIFFPTFRPETFKEKMHKKRA